MSRVRWITQTGILAIHDELILWFGGAAGVRDAGLLESALMRPQNMHHYEGETAVPVLAAAVGWGIIRNHPFVDGNKRAALAAVVTFCELNGWELGCPEAEETAMVLRAAASEITEVEWRAWLEAVGRKKNPGLKEV